MRAWRVAGGDGAALAAGSRRLRADARDLARAYVIRALRSLLVPARRNSRRRRQDEQRSAEHEFAADDAGGNFPDRIAVPRSPFPVPHCQSCPKQIRTT